MFAVRMSELATLIGEALGVEPVFRTISIEASPFANILWCMVETAE